MARWMGRSRSITPAMISTPIWECTSDGYSWQYTGHRKTRGERRVAHRLRRTLLPDDTALLGHEFSPLPVDDTGNILLRRDVAHHHPGCRHVRRHGARFAGV